MGLKKLGDECDTLAHAASLDCRRNGWLWADDTLYDPTGYSDWETEDEPKQHDVCNKYEAHFYMGVG